MSRVFSKFKFKLKCKFLTSFFKLSNLRLELNFRKMTQAINLLVLDPDKVNVYI